ncbi:ganglioside GM2 activator-like [Ptychodera flava]|uniref:ganglioside GM2 activator-like n=1 Tax=Ptychodera flava TaxID=63121 RepID=UPI00396A0859
MAVTRRSFNVLTALAFVVCFGVGFVSCLPADESPQYKLWANLLKTQTYSNSSNGTMLKMTWKNCGPSDPIYANLVITPETIPIPGKVNISFNATLNVTCDAPLKLEMKVKKKIAATYWTVPCIDNVGSCTYSDLCSMIPYPPSQPCPPPFSTYKIPCHCPFQKGAYHLPLTEIDLPAIPHADGKFKATAYLSMNGEQLACYEADLQFKAR